MLPSTNKCFLFFWHLDDCLPLRVPSIYGGFFFSLNIPGMWATYTHFLNGGCTIAMFNEWGRGGVKSSTQSVQCPMVHMAKLYSGRDLTPLPTHMYGSKKVDFKAHAPHRCASGQPMFMCWECAHCTLSAQTPSCQRQQWSVAGGTSFRLCDHCGHTIADPSHPLDVPNYLKGCHAGWQGVKEVWVNKT